jgi:hypothetical protein
MGNFFKCGFTSKNYPEINDVKPSVKTNYDGDGNTTKTITIVVSLY